MKTLNRFIIERLKLTKDSKLITYKFFPTSFDELRKLLERLLDERGKDANLNDIDVSKVESFYDSNKDLGLFEKLDPHNINISEWDVSNVTNMIGTFYICQNFNCNLSSWNVRNVEEMTAMFRGCTSFTGQGLENWDVSNVEDMQWMFQGCENFNCNLENWKPIKCQTMWHMFDECKNFTGQGLENWDVQSVKDMSYMFGGCMSLKNKPKWYKE